MWSLFVYPTLLPYEGGPERDHGFDTLLTATSMESLIENDMETGVHDAGL